jgi:hypothetical protein
MLPAWTRSVISAAAKLISAYFPDHGDFRRYHRHLAEDGPRPVRAGIGLALGF